MEKTKISKPFSMSPFKKFLIEFQSGDMILNSKQDASFEVFYTP